MSGFDIGGWVSKMKDTLYQFGANETRRLPMADELLPRELRAEGKRHEQRLRRKLLVAVRRKPSQRAPGKLERLRDMLRLGIAPKPRRTDKLDRLPGIRSLRRRRNDRADR